MGLLQDKLAKYTLPDEIKAKGIYPTSVKSKVSRVLKLPWADTTY